MAAKVKRGDVERPPSTHPAGRAKRWSWPHTAAGIALVIVAVFGAWWYAASAHLRVTLPPIPDMTAHAPALRDAIVAAQRRATSRGEMINRVTELAQLYHANGFLPEAETCWEILGKQQPNEARWVYYLADVRRSLNDASGASGLLRSTVQLAPQYAPAWLQLAMLQMKSGAIDEAAQSFRRRLELLPGDPHATLGLARIALLRGERDVARTELQQLVQSAPQFPPGQNLLAEMLEADGDIAGARKHRWLGREAGRFKEPDDPWLVELQSWCRDPKRLCVLGTMEYQTQNFARARSLLERAAELAPGDLEIRTLLAELYLKVNEPARARELVGKVPAAAALSPPIGFYVTGSEAHRAIGAVDDALALVADGLKIHPDAAELHRQRGLLLAHARQFDESTAAFGEALKRDPNDAESAFHLAIRAFESGRREQGRIWLERTIAVQPSHPQALTLLARLEMEAGRLDAAWAFLEPLYDSNSGVPQVRRLVGRWHWLAGNNAASRRELDRAENYYRAGAEVSPDDAELQASLGVLYLAAGNFPEAVRALEAYHRLEPQSARSALFLGQAYASVNRIPDARRVLELGERLAREAGQRETAANCREILDQLSRR
jgi:tetratricopeptide (TPR) repeat protein